MKNFGLISIVLLTGLQMLNAALVSNYSYDALGRLTSVSDSGNVQTEAYRYDGVGNILEKNINGHTYRLSYDAAHQLKSAEGPEGLRQFVYDDAGRLVSEVMNGKPVVKYTYGYLDKVIAVERSGDVTRFDYDASGMLVGKQLPDGSYEQLTWDGMALVARGEERYINEGHITGGLPIVSQSDEGLLYHQHDQLGTTVASFSKTGEVITVYESSVFGKGELANSRTARFTGKPYDADLGAYVFPFRNYDPEAVRWMSADPAGFPDGPNQHYYACVPTVGVDPLGLWSSVNDIIATDITTGIQYDVFAMSGGALSSVSSSHQNLIEGHDPFLFFSFDGLAGASVNNSTISAITQPVNLAGVQVNIPISGDVPEGFDVFRWAQVIDTPGSTSLALDGDPGSLPFYSGSSTLFDQPTRLLSSATKQNPVVWKAWSYLFAVNSANTSAAFMNVGLHWGFEIHEK